MNATPKSTLSPVASPRSSEVREEMSLKVPPKPTAPPVAPFRRSQVKGGMGLNAQPKSTLSPAVALRRSEVKEGVEFERSAQTREAWTHCLPCAVYEITEASQPAFHRLCAKSKGNRGLTKIPQRKSNSSWIRCFSQVLDEIKEESIIEKHSREVVKEFCARCFSALSPVA